MATLPRTKDGMIEYFEERLPLWRLDQAAIGITAAQIDALAAHMAGARDAYTAVQRSKQALSNKVHTQDASIKVMMGLGSALTALVRAFGETTRVLEGGAAAARVLRLAGLSPIAPRTPAPPPAPATNLQTSLLNTGGLKLTWKGTTANGTVYSVWRRTNNETSFTQIATSGTQTYKDQTVPASSTEVAYFLKTICDDLTSDDSEPITVRLGVTLDQSDTNTNNPELGIAA